MDSNELIAQVALGTLNNPGDIAKVVKVSSDAKILAWAARHNNGKVRAAAASNPLLPLGHLLSLFILEETMSVRRELSKVAKKRVDEICDGLLLLESYPQLTLPFKYAELITKKYKESFVKKLLRRVSY